MKKNLILLVIILLSISCTKVQMQSVSIVHDIIAMDEMIMQTAILERDVENQIKEIAYIYEFLQTQIKSIQKLNPDSYFAIRNFVIARDSAIKSLKSRIRNLGLKIDGKDYALGDVLPTDKEINEWFKSLEAAKKTKNTQQYLNTLDIINSKDANIRQYLSEISREAVAIGMDGDDFINNQRDYEDLLDKIDVNESITAQLQIGNQLSIELNMAINKLVQATSSLNKMYAANTLSDMFGDYRLAVPQQDSGSAGIDTAPSEDYDKYLQNRNENAFDPLELFNPDRR